MARTRHPSNFQWLAQCAPNSTLTTRDIAQIYNIKPKTVLDKVYRGSFPKHDIAVKRGKFRKHKWFVSTVIDQILVELGVK